MSDTVALDRDMWDSVPKEQREKLLRAALLGAHVPRLFRTRDYDLPGQERAIAVGLSADTSRIRALWQRELDRRTAAKAAKPAAVANSRHNVTAFGGGKR